MPRRLSAEETAKLLGPTPADGSDATRLAVRKTMPMRLSAEETAAALASGRKPDPGIKDMRPTTPPDASTEPIKKDVLDPSTGLGATLRGATQGGTFRMGDEIGAAAMMAPEAIGRASEAVGLIKREPANIEGHYDQESADAKSRDSMADVYRGLRDSLRADNKTAEKAHPMKYGFAEAGASSLYPVPGAGLMKGAPWAARMGLGAAQAAGAGALYGLGGSEAETFGGMAKDAAMGAGMSAPAGAAFGAASYASTPLAKYFSGKAGERAFQAAGARAGIVDRAKQMGIPEDQMGAEGRKFLEAGLIPTGLNPFRNPVRQTANRANAMKTVAGRRIGSAMEAADASGKDFDPLAAQEAMRAKMGIENPLMEDNAHKANKLIDQVGDMTPQGEWDSPGSFAQANKMKSQAWEGADFRQDAKMVPSLYKKANSGLRDDIQRQVGEATDPATTAALASANKHYSTAAKASTLAEIALSRDAQKQQFSPLRAAISGAGGLGIGGMAGGFGGAGAGTVLAPFVVEQLVKRGPNVAAHFNELASKVSSSPAAAAALQRLATELGVKTEDLYGDRLRHRFGGD